MLTGTNLTYTKAYNTRIVFETIRLFGPLSRADVARQTDLTPQTVSNIVKRLMDTGLIQEGPKRQAGRGAPSVTLEVNPAGRYSIGLDLNRDHLTGVLVDLTGCMKERLFFELDAPNPEEAIDLMASSAKQLMESLNLTEENLGGIGIGFPGPMEIRRNKVVTNLVNPKDFPNWNHVPVVDMLSSNIDVPIFLENNATAAAVGERRYGAGRHISSFLYTFFGAGLGGGLLLNNEFYEGYTGNAGEIGYLPFYGEPSPLSDSEQRHIGEHFNLTKLYKWLNQNGVRVSRPDELEALFDQKHPRFMEWLDKAKQMLAPAFMCVEHLIDPEVIFLGGRLPVPIIEDMCKGISDIMPELRVEGKATNPELRCATAGADAAALGAATLPMFDLFAPEPRVLIKNKKKKD